MKRILLAACAVLALSGNTWAKPKMATLTCEGSFSYKPPFSPERWAVGVYRIDAPEVTPWDGCWFNASDPPRNLRTLFKACQDGHRCRVRVYGQCQLPRIVEPGVPPCPSLYMMRVIWAKSVKDLNRSEL